MIDTSHDTDYYLRERYVAADEHSLPLRAYYALKPLLPDALILAMRRRYARRQAKRSFPRWPIEPLLVDRRADEFRERIHAAGGEPVPLVNFWPDGARYASVLTHDVEGPEGIELIEQVREIERRHGFVSAWYFVGDDYAIPDGLFDKLRAEGCEIGLHGIHHDGKLFSSRENFEAELPEIHRHLRDWGIVGFRSPATHRHSEWMSELGCLYDSSFLDTAPFEPQPGGCCSIVPYFLDDIIELPMTLTMDHTLWEILQDTSTAHWIEKTQWLIANHGLINLLVHPDYVTTPERMAAYDEFLAFLAAQPGGWHALPEQVARWWRAREALTTESLNGEAIDVGGAQVRPTLAHAREDQGLIVFEPADSRT